MAECFKIWLYVGSFGSPGILILPFLVYDMINMVFVGNCKVSVVKIHV